MNGWMDMVSLITLQGLMRGGERKKEKKTRAYGAVNKLKAALY